MAELPEAQVQYSLGPQLHAWKAIVSFCQGRTEIALRTAAIVSGQYVTYQDMYTSF